MKARLPKEYIEKYRLKTKQPQLTLYDLNKQMVAQMSPMTEENEQQHIEEIFNPFLTEKNNKYYMLLCKELSYFTLFHKDESNSDDFFKTLKELITSNGTLITACWTNEDTKESIEYWVRIKTPIENNPDFSEVYCFVLFPYDAGVVEVN